MKYPTCPECGAPPLLTYPTPKFKGVGVTWVHDRHCWTWSDGMPFTDEPEVKRIVINGRFGWFGLSDNAHFNLGSLKRDGSSTLSSAWELPMHLRDLSELDFRSHPDLLAVVDNLGRDADGRSAYLYVVEVPIEFDDDIHIAEYDGREHIAQNHRRWS